MRAIFATTAVAILGFAAAMPAQAATVSPVHWGAWSGDGNPADRDITLTPTPVPIRDPAAVAQVGTSNSTDYALLTDGTVWAWGQGTNGQLGDGHTRNSLSTPVQVRFPAGVKIAFLATNSMPFNTALAVDTTGHAWGWGGNTQGELCLGAPRQYTTPQELPLARVTSLAGASGHAIYVAGGTAYVCGANGSGVSGTGTMGKTLLLSPVRVPALTGVNVSVVFASYQNDAALTAAGAYYDWGLNADGQLGDGSTANSDVPVQVKLPGPVASAALGGSQASNGQTVVGLADGTDWSWGSNAYGQVLGATGAAQISPLRFTPPARVTFTAFASGEGTEFGLDAAGNVWAWGENNTGQAGDGTKVTATAPVMIASGMAQLSATAGGAAAAPLRQR